MYREPFSVKNPLNIAVEIFCGCLEEVEKNAPELSQWNRVRLRGRFGLTRDTDIDVHSVFVLRIERNEQEVHWWIILHTNMVMPNEREE